MFIDFIRIKYLQRDACLLKTLKIVPVLTTELLRTMRADNWSCIASGNASRVASGSSVLASVVD